jgi:hypothetical protein
MRRAHAILVILALLATPMALLARSDCNQSACDCMCDLVNRTLLAHGHHGPILCGGQAAGSMHHCVMNTKHHPPDYGLNALMAPTAPPPVATLGSLPVAAQLTTSSALAAPSGFFSAPFEPPRS